MIDKCTHTSGCKYPIQNKKYKLCSDHMYEKIHGRSRKEVYAERAATKPVKVYKIKTYAPPKQQTKKQVNVATALGKLKHDIEMEAIHSDMYYCWSCGYSHSGLDKSHILSVGQFKHLELDKDNINLFCRDCHNIWEHGSIQEQIKSLTFEKDLEYIRENSSEYFSKYLNRMLDYLKFADESTEISKKMIKILKKYGQIVA